MIEFVCFLLGAALGGLLGVILGYGRGFCEGRLEQLAGGRRGLETSPYPAARPDGPPPSGSPGDRA